MRIALGAPLGVAITLALLGACSKPASETADAATADAASATAAAADAGGVVSPPPSTANDPINADANLNDASQAAASNSFTEGQAKGHFENAGYTNVTGLTKTADGMWTAKAMKGGKSMDVSLDFKGAVTAK